MTLQHATSTAWSAIRLPDQWPSEGARQLYLAMRRDPGTNSAYHAAQQMCALKSREVGGAVTSPDTRQVTHWLRGSWNGARRRPSYESMLLIERLYPSVTPPLWTQPPRKSVAETLAHFEDAA